MENYVKFETVPLKTHPEINEKWVQQKIDDDPGILGSGELFVRQSKEKASMLYKRISLFILILILLVSCNKNPNMMEGTVMPSSLDEIKAYIDSGDERTETSNRITSIRRLWHENKSENFFLEGSLASVMQAIGERDEYNYWFFNALTGNGFVMLYHPEGGSYGLTSLFKPEFVTRAFEACGYSSLYIDEAAIAANPETVMEAIKSSVDRGVPVITAGIGGVFSAGGDSLDEYHPCWAVIGGYDGDDLLVNVFYENIETDEIGYVKAVGGLEKSKGIFILKEKVSDPDIEDIYRDIILSIPDKLSTSPEDGFAFGKDAYYKWAETLLDDSLFEDGFNSWDLFGSAWVVVATNGVFFRGDFVSNFMVDLLTELPDFTVAKDVYNLYLIKMYGKINDFQRVFDPDMSRFCISDEQLKNRGIREEMAGYLREAGDIHDEIVKVILEYTP